MLGPGVDGARRIGTSSALGITGRSTAPATHGDDQAVVELVTLIPR